MPKKLPLVEISTPNLNEFAALVDNLNFQLRKVRETIQKINDFELEIDIQLAKPGK